MTRTRPFTATPETSNSLRRTERQDAIEFAGKRIVPGMALMEKRLGVAAQIFLIFPGHILAGKNKNRKLGGAGMGAPLGEQFETADVRQTQIEDCEFRQEKIDLSARLSAVRCGDNDAALRSEHFGNEFSRGYIVLDNESGPDAAGRGVYVDSAREGREERGFIDRLHQVFIGTEQCAHAGLIKNRDDEDGDVCSARVALQLREDFPAIFRLHDNVERDGAGLKLNCMFERFLRFVANQNVIAGGAELRVNELCGGFVVFNDEDAGKPRDAGKLRGFGRDQIAKTVRGGKREVETTAMAEFAFESELAAMQFDQAVSNGKAQAGSFGVSTRFAQPVESFENALLFFRRNSRAAIAHFDANVATNVEGIEFDEAAVRSEFDGVAEKIHEDLAKPGGIGTNDHGGLDALRQRVRFAVAERAHDA